MNTHTHTINHTAICINYQLKHSHIDWSVLENITNVIENYICVKQKWENDIYVKMKSKISLCPSFAWMFAWTRFCMCDSVICRSSTYRTHNTVYTSVKSLEKIATTKNNNNCLVWMKLSLKPTKWYKPTLEGVVFNGIGCVFVLINKSIVLSIFRKQHSNISVKLVSINIYSQTRRNSHRQSIHEMLHIYIVIRHYCSTTFFLLAQCNMLHMKRLPNHTQIHTKYN